MKDFIKDYFDQVKNIAETIDLEKIEKLIDELVLLKKRKGRLFFIGVGGSAANCSHAVNDFRKLVDIETYSPVDNVSELTARTNDEGWESVFSEWLKTSKANENDAVFVLSVGGGDISHNISPNIVKAVIEAKNRSMKVFGVVGRKDGYTNQAGDVVIVVSCPDLKNLTPLSESFQAVIWHCIVSHPKLKEVSAKWESLDREKANV